MPIKETKIRLFSSEFEEMINKRQVSSDTVFIDKKIWNEYGKTYSIMVTDLSGFTSNSIERGILNFISLIYEAMILTEAIVEENNGEILKTIGDTFVILFPNPKDSVKCAIEIQNALRVSNKIKAESLKLHMSVGIGYGQVLKVSNNDIFGVELNIASKLGEDIGIPNEILISEEVRNYINEYELLYNYELITTEYNIGKVYKLKFK
ncbi:adenylate/guanylate cyclase domain-containing protein [Oceanirhabdus seepicola]|uniref:Adenylate/guanylate cyclase domain-containing protein n=1 Tax=Oceanirhabdus seepicola TaxID=2828781 RepID=A0A9J6P799_9CLOT|nr:adenylate/guanylate cyclase domain-containing protein [Oceanirhabdus seepicola]MCM1992786.1 adenylate/guanylate cyclase domain-containing protein [Oceanirhabdus seepicola]